MLPSMSPEIKPMQRSDWEAVRHIYEERIATGHATFETEVPGWETWNASHLRECRLVAREEGWIVGWGALSPVSSRCVYGGVARRRDLREAQPDRRGLSRESQKRTRGLAQTPRSSWAGRAVSVPRRDGGR